ncbi:MAG: hypothetical protein CVU29_10615 [Betaproteobacteria bacterium HGW-Betaproteobacteria-22]|nr:MAG: hypothetical protein CVU29_10615 [Betaproteobacteria bacterium HGW-Betaproteobacteria-22]
MHGLFRFLIYFAVTSALIAAIVVAGYSESINQLKTHRAQGLTSTHHHLNTKTDCRIQGYPYQLTCGEIEVPRFYPSRPLAPADHFTKTAQSKIVSSSQDTLVLKWYKIASRALYPKLDPVIWIPGGLGIDATERAPAMSQALNRILNTRDLIWLEVRGSAETPFNCKLHAPMAIASGVDHFSNNQHLKACQAFVIKQGGLAAFAPEQIAQDYEQLRVQMGITSVNVLTEGHGAKVVNLWAALAPQSLRSIIMDSPPMLESAVNQASFDQVTPLQQQSLQLAKALQALIKACQQDFVCHQAFFNLDETIHALIKQLPKQIKVNNPYHQLPERVTVTAELFAQMLKTALRQPEHSSKLPMVLHMAMKGDWQPLIALDSQRWLSAESRFSDGLYLASLCHNNQAEWAIKKQSAHWPLSLELSQSQEKYVSWFYQTEYQRLSKLCAPLLQNTPSDTLHSSIDKPEISKSQALPFAPEQQFLNKPIPDKTIPDKLIKVPTLMLIGELDPMAGDAWPQYTQATTINVAAAGSNILAYSCARDVVYRFINAHHFDAEMQTTIQPQCLFNITYPTIPHPSRNRKSFQND